MGMHLKKMSVTEFLACEEHQPERHELYLGETFAMVGGKAGHNRVILNLASRVGELRSSLCNAFQAVLC